MNFKCLGAIIGDIVGSIYEFNNIKTKDFEFFSANCGFTDDSIMTIATMKALIDGGEAENFKYNYQLFGNKYPSSYGVGFGQWLRSQDPQPYSSWGNGSAMRVSPVAWFYSDIASVEHAAELSASVTHNHKEGIKGAQATAAAIFMARTAKSKQEIKDYIENRYEYLLDFSLADIRPSYKFDESCAGTVPPAIVAFLESTDFEDAIRNAVSLGGDSDTLAAITGSIAEAYYGVPDEIANKTLSYLADGLVSVLNQYTYHLKN